MFLFTSESVSEGHPDKLCDQLSDTLLDAFFEQDPLSRVAVECFITTGLVVVGGEVTTKAQVDIQDVVRKKLESIGYTHPEIGLDAKSCAVLVVLNRQSPDIAQGVNENDGAFKEYRSWRSRLNLWLCMIKQSPLCHCQSCCLTSWCLSLQNCAKKIN